MSKEPKDERFVRLAEARVNKIIKMVRLLGNLSWSSNYSYTQRQVEQIFTALQTELDCCWVNVGGEDPAAYIRKYAGRCPVVHLKDFTGTKSKNMYNLIGMKEVAETTNTFAFRPVGYGKQDIPTIITAAIESGAKYLVVEQDNPGEQTSLEAVAMSRNYLKTLGF